MDSVDIFGPFKAPIYKINNRYRYQIFIKGEKENVDKLKLKIKEAVFKHSSKEVRITVDVDPINLM